MLRLFPLHFRKHIIRNTRQFTPSSHRFDSSDGTASSRSSSIVPQFGENVPRLKSALILPIIRRPIFPDFMSSINIRNEKIIDTLLQNESNKFIGLFLRKDKGVGVDEIELITDLDQIHNVGTFAQIQHIQRNSNGAHLALIGHRRITIDRMIDFGPPTIADISHWKKTDIVDMTPNIQAHVNEVLQVTRELIKLNPLAHEHINQWVARTDLSNPYKLADFAAVMTTATGDELQLVLECENVEERLSMALNLLMKERELAKLQQEIKKQVEDKISDQQRKYFLQEQYKSIRNELGMDKDDKEELLGKYKEKLDAIQNRAALNPEILKTIEEEMKKLGTLERNSAEFNVTRSYLDWLTAVPWGALTADLLDLKQARTVLDADHFGLDEVKKRILEFIAVGKLKKTVKGKIICLIGPPGVGKTSIAKSIASALGRKFYRFSVGGLTDIAEIKGHRRTYVGAMPGKPIQCLKQTGSVNPLILIDEVDKLGRGYNGDPASALLELLDPNQNSSFVDHYLDVPVDFSDVLFVCTANDEGSIPGPLKDRMEIIRLSGYDIPEKVAIASRYLVPKALHEAGFTESSGVQVSIDEAALEALVRSYCRESGVRSLEKHIEKIVRKIAFDTVYKAEEDAAGAATTSAPTPTPTPSPIDTTLTSVSPPPPHPIETESTRTSSPAGNAAHSTPTAIVTVTVTAADLEKYVGQPRYPQDTIYDTKDSSLPVGIVMGLAWNPLGGSPIFIETAAIPTAVSETGGGVNVVTGQLGSVMKESVNIAYTFARQFVAKRYPENMFFKSHQLHLHVPEGAVEKDGPSAGIAMTCSIVSLSLSRPLRPHLAMTGEISLTGKVLPVGGIKEKVLAARRAGAQTVILPHTNRRDHDELPAYVKEAVKFYFARDYEEVFNIAFGEDDSRVILGSDPTTAADASETGHPTKLVPLTEKS